MDKKSKIAFVAVISIIVFAGHLRAQDIAAKTNLLYGGVTLTPNIGAEVSLSKQYSLALSASYNPWKLKGNEADNKKLVHWMGQAELRYWPCQTFDGHFFGVHGLFSQYNVSQRNLDFLFGSNSRDHRYEGFATGGGISYGYQWMLGKRWNLEATIGIGVVYLDYDKYQCKTCGDLVESKSSIYVGPTRLGITLVYIIK